MNGNCSKIIFRVHVIHPWYYIDDKCYELKFLWCQAFYKKKCLHKSTSVWPIASQTRWRMAPNKNIRRFASNPEINIPCAMRASRTLRNLYSAIKSQVHTDTHTNTPWWTVWERTDELQKCGGNYLPTDFFMLSRFRHDLFSRISAPHFNGCGGRPRPRRRRTDSARARSI